MDRKIAWKQMTGQYQNGFDGYLGKIRVAEVFTPSQSKSYEGPRWRANVLLPGISVKAGLLKDTPEEAQAVAERVVAWWFGKLEE